MRLEKVWRISDNRIDADDQKINELRADGILNEIDTDVFWLDKGAIHYSGKLSDYFTTAAKEMIARGIFAVLNPVLVEIGDTDDRIGWERAQHDKTMREIDAAIEGDS